MTESPLLTAEEFFKQVHIRPTAGYERLRSGEWHAVKVGKRWLVPRKVVADIVAKAEEPKARADGQA